MQETVEYTEALTGYTLVFDDGKVTIPTQWLCLQSGEEVISTYGHVFQMNCWHWFYSIITFGYQYCCDYRLRKFSRTAIILTNRRVLR